MGKRQNNFPEEAALRGSKRGRKTGAAGLARYGLNGERGLLLAVLSVAVTDARFGNGKHRKSAIRFFRSDWYRHMLTTLDLPPHWLPEGVDTHAAR